MADLRVRGWRGGIITRHRAFATLEPSAVDLTGAAALMVGFTLAWIRLLRPLAELWRRLFQFWAHALHLEGSVIMVPQNWGTQLHFALPCLSGPAGPITPLTWSLTALVTVLALTASYSLSEEMLPAAYLLRALVLIQSGALVYFAFAAARFPHDLPSYTIGMLVFGVILIGLVPIMLAFTYYVFDFSFWKKLALTALTMGHLALLIPLQYMLHIYILRHSILYMPLLYFALGPFLDVLVFVSLYSWGMSWKSRHDAQIA